MHNLVKLLLEAGADVNARIFIMDLTPSQVAEMNGHNNVADFLRMHEGNK